MFDIVSFNCEKLHWTVDHGNPTEVPPPTSEIPVTEPELTTEEVETTSEIPVTEPEFTTEEVENTSVWTVPPLWSTPAIRPLSRG